MKPEYDPTKVQSINDDLTASMVEAAQRGDDHIIRDGVLVSVTQARAEAASREAEYMESRRPSKKPKLKRSKRNRKEKVDPQAAREELDRLSRSTWIQPPPVGIPDPTPVAPDPIPVAPYAGIVQRYVPVSIHSFPVSPGRYENDTLRSVEVK